MERFRRVARRFRLERRSESRRSPPLQNGQAWLTSVPCGKRQILGLYLPGDLCEPFGALPQFTDYPVASLTPVTFMSIPAEAFTRSIAASANVSEALWWDLLVASSIEREHVVSLGRRSASERLGHLFCELQLRLAMVGLADETGYDLPLSQIDMSDVLGLSAVHVNRSLPDLRRDGLITFRGRHLTIEDLPRLQALSLFDPDYLHPSGRRSRQRGQTRGRCDAMNDDADGLPRLAALEADNRRLRQLLEQSNTPAELRHRLRSTVANLRTMIRRSAETPRSLEDYVAHLDDRVDAVSRAQSMADDYGAIDLHKLLADELLRYNLSEGDRFSVSGPVIEFQPRAGQVFALAIHELAVNGVEHGELGTRGRLQVDWRVEDRGEARMFAFAWKELDTPQASQPSAPGFGTDVLVRMLGYECQAVTTLDFEPDGLLCRIEMPLPPTIGERIEG